MKKILFDLKAIQPTSKNSAKFHGGGEYTKELFLEIVDMNLSGLEIFYDQTLFMDDKILKKIKEKEIKINYIESIDDVQKLIKNGNYKLFISFLPYTYFNLNFYNTKTLFTIHGLRAIEKPVDSYNLKYKKKSYDLIKFLLISLFTKIYVNKQLKQFEKLLSKSTYVLVPSHHTKYSLKSFLPKLDIDKLILLHSPIVKVSSISESYEKQFLNKYNLECKKYILLISTDRWIKNSYRAICALNEIYNENNNVIKTVLVGDRRMMKHVEKKENFICLDYLERDELEILYKNAFVFLYPTLNEGFGYPPIEAMKYGTLVLTSAVTSINEVCSDSVIYFNPYDVTEIKNRILMTLNEMCLQVDYNIKGKKRYEYLLNIQNIHIEGLIKLINKV